MKYSIVYLGLMTLSSVTYSALISPATTKNVDVVTLSSAPRTTGPEFPVKLYGRKSSNRASRRKDKTCDPVTWRHGGKPHCGAEGRWPCYRQCVKGKLLRGDRRVETCKWFCKNMDDMRPSDCTTSSDDEYGCTIPTLLQEIAAEKVISAMKKKDAVPDDNTPGDKVAKRCRMDCTWYIEHGEICPTHLDGDGDCLPDE